MPPTTLGNDLRTEAAAALTEVGIAATLSYGQPATASPSGMVFGAAESTMSVTCSPVMTLAQRPLQVASPRDAAISTASGRVMLAASGLTQAPSVGNAITISGLRWEIVWVDVLNSDESAAAYRCYVAN